MDPRPPTNRYGRLTRRQELILSHVVAGNLQKNVAAQLELGFSTVRNECSSITRKLGASTFTQAATMWERAGAYRRSADLLLNARTTHPSDSAEEHVNHVLTNLAEILNERARRILGQ